ncbi:MAG: hypothetical protein FJ096_10985 [Deltaproteobacteria bacterium]|nr:hypothetical protein [Deltaproteobacteria bacterium]
MGFDDQKFLVAAFVLHLALPVAAAVAPERRWPGKLVAPPTPSSEIDVDASALPELPETEAARENASNPETPAATARERRAEPSRERADTEPADPAAPDADAPPERREPEEVARGAETSPDSFPSPEPGAEVDPMGRPPSQYEVGGPGLGLPGLGSLPLGALPSDARGRNPAPTETLRRTHEPEAARRAIDRGMRVKDAQLGLDFPGASAIGAVLRDAVRGSDAPFECQGSFSVAVSPDGRVTSVNLGGFRGGDPGTWQIIRKQALAQLKSRVFEMKSSFARGALVGVTIRSEHKMPGGGVSRQGASFSFDVADVGAKPVRVVSMSFSARPVE